MKNEEIYSKIKGFSPGLPVKVGRLYFLMTPLPGSVGFKAICPELGLIIDIQVSHFLFGKRPRTVENGLKWELGVGGQPGPLAAFNPSPAVFITSQICPLISVRWSFPHLYRNHPPDQASLLERDGLLSNGWPNPGLAAKAKRRHSGGSQLLAPESQGQE